MEQKVEKITRERLRAMLDGDTLTVEWTWIASVTPPTLWVKWRGADLAARPKG